MTGTYVIIADHEPENYSLKKGEKMSENEKIGTEPEFPEMCHNLSKDWKFLSSLKVFVTDIKLTGMTLPGTAFSHFMTWYLT
jgi:hypothetical protein